MARSWNVVLIFAVFRNVVSDTVLSAHKDEVQPFDPQVRERITMKQCAFLPQSFFFVTREEALTIRHIPRQCH